MSHIPGTKVRRVSTVSLQSGPSRYGAALCESSFYEVTRRSLFWVLLLWRHIGWDCGRQGLPLLPAAPGNLLPGRPANEGAHIFKHIIALFRNTHDVNFVMSTLKWAAGNAPSEYHAFWDIVFTVGTLAGYFPSGEVLKEVWVRLKGKEESTWGQQSTCRLQITIYFCFTTDNKNPHVWRRRWSGLMNDKCRYEDRSKWR